MKFMIPYMYGINTRAKSIVHKISLLIVFIMPIFSASIYGNNDIFYVAPRFIIAFTALYCVYEIGYIFNDTYTVRFEDNPTYRLGYNDRQNVDKYANLLIAFRIFVVIISVVLLKYLRTSNIIYFIIMLGLLNLAYAFHNLYRGKENIFTIFFVLVFKYITIPILFVHNKDYFIISMSLILIIPLLRTIEFAGKKEYKIKLFKNYNYDKFRVIYYIVLLLFFLLLQLTNKDLLFALIDTIILLIYRLLSLFVVQKSKLSVYIHQVRNGKKKTGED